MIGARNTIGTSAISTARLGLHSITSRLNYLKENEKFSGSERTEKERGPTHVKTPGGLHSILSSRCWTLESNVKYDLEHWVIFNVFERNSQKKKLKKR